MNEYIDCTKTDSAYRQVLTADDLRNALHVWHLLPEALNVKVGSLEVVHTAGGSVYPSIIRINGVDMPVKSLTLTGEVEGAWQAKIEFYPGLVCSACRS